MPCFCLVKYLYIVFGLEVPQSGIQNNTNNIKTVEWQ